MRFYRRKQFVARSRNVLRIGQHSATGQQKTMALNQAKQVFLTAYIGIQAAYAETRIGAQVAQRHGLKPLGTSQPQGRVDDTNQIFNRNLPQSEKRRGGKKC